MAKAKHGSLLERQFLLQDRFFCLQTLDDGCVVGFHRRNGNAFLNTRIHQPSNKSGEFWKLKNIRTAGGNLYEKFKLKENWKRKKKRKKNKKTIEPPWIKVVYFENVKILELYNSYHSKKKKKREVSKIKAKHQSILQKIKPKKGDILMKIYVFNRWIIDN